MAAKSKRGVWILVLLLIIVGGVFLLFVRGTKQDLGEDAREDIRYRLKWLANVGFVGDLYADTYGFFLEEGLRVKVRPGGPEHNAIRELETGEAHFGVASADQVLRALDKKADVVVIAQIYRSNPVQWIYRSEKISIKQPSDLKAQRVGITIGDNDETIMYGLLNKYGIDHVKPGDTTKKTGNTSPVILDGVHFDFLPFTKGKVSLFPVYKNTQGVDLRRQLEAEGEQVAFFNPDVFGIRFVANSIVTTSRMVRDKGPLVRCFLKAVLKGWRHALDPKNEDLAVRAMLRFVAENEPEAGDALNDKLREQLAVTRELVLPEAGSRAPLGTIDVQAWKQTEGLMLQLNLIGNKVGIEGYLRTDLPLANSK